MFKPSTVVIGSKKWPNEWSGRFKWAKGVSFSVTWLSLRDTVWWGAETSRAYSKAAAKDPIDLIQASHQNAFWMPLEVFQARQTEKNLVYLEPRRGTGAGQKLTGGIMYLI